MGDERYIMLASGNRNISTHTPAGDERWIPDSSKNHRELQSTPPYGDELWTVSDFAQEQLFQPTPPYGDEPRIMQPLKIPS